MKVRRDLICRNPRCGDRIKPEWDGGEWTGLCPSCRLAGRWGAYVAFAVLFLGKLVTWWLG